MDDFQTTVLLRSIDLGDEIKTPKTCCDLCIHRLAEFQMSHAYVLEFIGTHVSNCLSDPIPLLL